MIRIVFIHILFLSGAMLFGQDFTSSNLPILLVDTDGQEIPDEPKIEVSFGIIYNGPGAVNFLSDPPNEYDGFAGIERRGSTSQTIFPKIGYGLETRNFDGSNNNVSLLGMPEENDWVLHGPYSDKTLIRNVLAYNLAAKIFPWAPRTRFCELVINGEYLGVYVLLESIKEDGGRVDIATLNPDDLEGDQLTGGYILKIDKETGSESDGFVSLFKPVPGQDQFIFFQYHDPRPEDIQPAQQMYIQSFMDAFEINLNSNDFDDPDLGYSQYINPQSFIDFFIINEIARNVDGYRLSTFLYKDRDSVDNRLHMGPVWDFNIAFGNANYCEGQSTEGLAVHFNQVCSGDFWLVPFWWDRLLSDSSFSCDLKMRWEGLREGAFSNDAVLETIDSLVGVIGDAADRNFEKWPVLGEPVWPNFYIGGSYEEEIGYLKNWLTERMNYLDVVFSQVCESSSSGGVTNTSTLEVRPTLSLGEFIEFHFYQTRSGTTELRVFDAAGRLVGQEIAGLDAPGKTVISWDPAVAPGMYFFMLFQNGEIRFTGKVVRQ